MNELWRPTEVEASFRSLLGAVAQAALPSAITLTSHWPILGTAPRRLLIVGQAVFGWIPSWRISDIGDESGVEAVIRETQRACYERADPMSWIVENRVRNSPFWRMTRRLVELTYPGSPHDWYGHVAWANIYPVARNDVKGNPEGPLRDAQRDRAAPLLDAVVRAVKPDAVVVLGGTYWWDVARQLPFDRPTEVERPLLAAGTRLGTSWIAGWHPGGAQRRGWGASVYSERIRAAMIAAST